jgi:dTDP-4-dehydrorhamnose reductase
VFPVNVLIAGAGGQLGRALITQVPGDVKSLVGMDRSTLDLSRAADIANAIATHEPSILINAAAYTAVDQAESDVAGAYAINAAAVAVMGNECARRGIRLVHVSTDFVFDGDATRPYRPDDTARPLSVYGSSKLAGEQALIAQPGLDWRIVRTAWVYASSGRNFVLTMLRLFRERPVVRVVADQIGTPTSARSLAQCVWAAALDAGSPAILHFTDAGVASWYDFAVAIYEEARALGLITAEVKIEPIRTDQYPTPARRPAFSVLDCDATRERLGLSAVHWRKNLRETLRELVA